MRDFFRFSAWLIVLLAAGVVQAQNWQPEWTVATLSQPRDSLAAAAAGNDVFCGGGYGNNGYSNVVDIYNTSTNTWSTAALSQPLEFLAAAAAGNDVVFAGGQNTSGFSNLADIYNTSTNAWSTAKLSQARIYLAAAAAGNDVVFAGGTTFNWYSGFSNVVDIYNTSTGGWSTATLSQSREDVAAAAAGNDVFLAGGYIGNGNGSNIVDIYNTSTNTWSTATLSQARYAVAAAAAGNDVVFAGGETGTGYSNVVDIYNTSTGAWSTATLSQARNGPAAAATGNYVVFAGGAINNVSSNVVDIYNTSTNTWSTATLSQARYAMAAAAAGNDVVFAGGWTGSSISNVVDILHLPTYTTISSSSAYTLWLATTVSGRITLSSPGSLNMANYTLNVGSMSGNVPIDLGSGTLTTGSDNTSATYSGNISDAGTLVKVGSGKLVLAGSNTYTGPTAINQGSLLVNGSLVSPVTVNSGGTLGGTGNLSSGTVSAGGQVAPGSPLGTMRFSGGLVLSSGADMDFELDTPSTSSMISCSSLTLGGQQFSSFAFPYTANFAPGTYYLIESGSLPSGVLGNSTSGTIDGLPATLAVQGNDVVLNVVPEPGTLALLGAAGVVGLLCYGLRLRRALRETKINQSQGDHVARNQKGRHVMRMMRIATMAAFCLLWTLEIARGQVLYNVTNLGTLPGGCDPPTGYAGVTPTSINNEGQIVGAIYNSSSAERAFLYSSGTMQDLGTLGGTAACATAVNDSGQVAGWAYASNGHMNAFLDSGGVMQNLGTMGGTASVACGINNAGQVVGYTTDSSGYAHAFLYSGGSMQSLGSLSGYPNSYACAINNSGQIAGYCKNSSGSEELFLSSNGTMYDMGPIGSYPLANVAGINNSGQIVGTTVPTSGNYAYLGFVYAGGAFQSIGSLFAGYYSQALGINDSGQVVGMSETQYSGLNTNVAVLYSNGTLLNLSNMTAPLQPNSFYGATAINDKGQIVVYGFANTAYLLTPLPVANWRVDADGNWSGPGNWSTTVPNEYCTGVLFGSATTAPRTVTVDVAVTAGTLQFNSANAYTLSGSATVTLESSNNADAAISVLNGSHTIAAPLVLSSNLDVTVNNPGDTLTVSGVVSGASRMLKKFGAGTLLLTANETYSGGTIISAGTLALGNGGATGMVPGSVTNNGTLVFNLAGNQFLSGGISGSGSVVTSGPAAISVQGALAVGQVAVNQGQFTVAGATVTGGLSIAPSAGFYNSAGTAYLGNLANGGVFASSAQVSGGFSNASTGDVRIPAGQSLFLAGAVPQSNAGLIEALGTQAAPVQVESVGPFTNAFGGGNGIIAAESATFHFDSGLTNQGLFGYSFGSGNVVGQIANSGGTISVNGGAAVTFVGNVAQNGALLVNSAGSMQSSAVFLGTFSGSGGFSGGGNVFFAAGLQPGDAPAEVLFGGNAYLEATTTTVMELHGTTAGSQYDKIDAAGQLVLAGDLDVELIDGFSPQAGETFDLFSGSLSGAFSQVSLPALSNGLSWNTSNLDRNGTISVVPEPSTLALLAAGTIGLLGYAWRRRNRKA